MKYEAVIFDLGGTLINQSTWEEQENYIRRMAGVLSILYVDFHRLWQETYEDRTKGTFGSVQGGIRYICRQLRKPVEEYKIEAAANITLEITKCMVMSPRKDAIEVITQLRAQGLKTGLVSNWSEQLPEVWQHCPLSLLIDVAVFSSKEGMMKPDPRIFQLASERLKVKPEQCLYIADGMDRELAGAKTAGMKAAMVRYPDDVDSNPYLEKWDGPVISLLEDILTLVS
jgi:putative hydrolase of the HAD superfamily